MEVVYLTGEVLGERGLGSWFCNSIRTPLAPTSLTKPMITHVIVSLGGGGERAMIYVYREPASGGGGASETTTMMTGATEFG